MKMKMYAIKDIIVGELMNIILMHNDEEAKRTFKEAVNANNPQSNICKNYKDMQMIYLGEYDTMTGVTTSDVRFLVNGVDLKEEPKPFMSYDIKPEETAKEE